MLVTNAPKNEPCRITTISVFPGIDCSFVDAHGHQSVRMPVGQKESVLTILYCREGRSGLRLGDAFVCLSAGDLMIVRDAVLSPVWNLPLGHYHGLTLRIDLDRTPHCLSCFLDDVEVQPRSLAEKFCGNQHGYIARAHPAIAHIFSEIYAVPESIQRGYCKIKTLELLLFLSQLSIQDDELATRLHTRSQVALAQRIASYLSAHLEERVTLEQLSDAFHVSPAHIKNTFRNVYGVPVGAYVRTLKMESAASQLERTDKTILEIAAAHGYDNGSKFASAFRTVKGMNPAQYRSEMRSAQKSIRLEPLSVGSERKAASLSGIIRS